ncbi:MAG: uroporphyrinogen-III synthase, partial [Terriglobales bacterium]
RSAEQAGELLSSLEAEGAEAIALPTIAIAAPLDPAPLEAALAWLARFDGFVFTSANAVRAVFARTDALAVSSPAGWICAVGPATAAALAERPGWKATLLPASAQAAGVAAALAAMPMAGQQVLFPRAEGAGDLIPRMLTERGASVVYPVAYRTIVAESSRAAAQALFPEQGGALDRAGTRSKPGVDAAVFTSPSTARNLAVLLSENHADRMRELAITVIGPVTEAAVRQLGWQVSAVAQRPDPASIVTALRSCWRA